MKKRVGICVAGLGMGIEHARAYSRMENVDLYIYDIDKTRIEMVRKEVQPAGVFFSIDEALASTKVDALDTVLPHNLHHPVALQASKAGKHYMTEKPMACNLKEADSMITEAREAGTILSVAENFQFLPSTRKAVDLINSGHIGDVFLVRVEHEMWQVRYSVSSWWYRREIAGGGVLLCAGIHAVRTLRMLGGSEVQLIHAVGNNLALGIESEDTCIVSVEFENGALGNLIASWGTPRLASSVFSVYGKEGAIIDTGQGSLLVRSRRMSRQKSEEKELSIDVPETNTIQEVCRRFAEAVSTGQEDEAISAKQGRKDLEVVEAAYRSIKTGEAVNLSLKKEV